MATDPKIPPPPVPPATSPVPPPLTPTACPPPGSWRSLLAILLSLCLGLFLVDAAISFVDDCIGMIMGVHVLMHIRIVIALLASLAVIVVYFLTGLTPIIPKRIFIPLALFYLAAELAGIPLFFLCSEHLQRVNWCFSIAQVLCGLAILNLAQGGFKLSWPLVPLARLAGRSFSWRNVIGFGLANVFILLPLVLIYLFFCTAGLVDHFTAGFMTLHPRGFTVEVRKYVRADGKTIQLFPMSHVAEAAFYQDISQTFPTNSLILMEGVTDEKHLLRHQINYQRMARTLGLAEQHEQFEPTRGEIVPADIDVEQFSTNTLALLNLVIRIHLQGLDVSTIQQMMQYSMAPQFQEKLFDDLLLKRNQHLLEQIRTHLPETEHIVVPWGVAHMPGVAREIQRAGFRLAETKEYEVIKFHGFGSHARPAAPPKPSSKG